MAAAAEKKAKRDEGSREVRVTGNTYPLKEEIKKIPGARFKNGSWYIPAKHAGKLPRKLGYEE